MKIAPTFTYIICLHLSLKPQINGSPCHFHLGLSQNGGVLPNYALLPQICFFSIFSCLREENYTSIHPFVQIKIKRVMFGTTLIFHIHFIIRFYWFYLLEYIYLPHSLLSLDPQSLSYLVLTPTGVLQFSPLFHYRIFHT